MQKLNHAFLSLPHFLRSRSSSFPIPAEAWARSVPVDPSVGGESGRLLHTSEVQLEAQSFGWPELLNSFVSQRHLQISGADLVSTHHYATMSMAR